MADNPEEEKQASRGNDWEVVSLTASTYAASPGPTEVEGHDDSKSGTHGMDDAETSRALFLSGHFVFPPSEHENLPLEPLKHLKPHNSGIYSVNVGKDALSESGAEEGGRSGGKDEDDWTLKGMNVHNDFPGIQLFDEKGNTVSIHGAEFEESGLKFIDKEQSLYSAATFGSLHSESALSGSAVYGENTETSVPYEASEQASTLPAEMIKSPQSAQDDKCANPDLPSEAWWKRRAVALYSHAKDANAFWSVFIAAAVMGLVILGQRWQQDRWQALQLRWQLSVNNEKTGRMMGPISRLKDVIVGGQRRSSFIRSGSE